MPNQIDGHSRWAWVGSLIDGLFSSSDPAPASRPRKLRDEAPARDLRDETRLSRAATQTPAKSRPLSEEDAWTAWAASNPRPAAVRGESETRPHVAVSRPNDNPPSSNTAAAPRGEEKAPVTLQAPEPPAADTTKPEDTSTRGGLSSWISNVFSSTPDTLAEEKASNKPVIAILVESRPGFSSNFNRNSGPVYITGGRTMQYAEAVQDHGGHVRWVWDDGRPPAEQLDGVHGLLIPGGGDIHPEVYGQKQKPGVHLNLTPYKFDVWECRMIEAAQDKKLPMRGICRGMQLMNIVNKGTLMQDIADHTDRPWKYNISHRSASHPIVVLPGSEFGRVAGTDILHVNSSHHQALDKIADGFVPVAMSGDGIVEAFEAVGDASRIGVQFHPERMSGDFKRRFFTTFVEDAAVVRGPVKITAPPPAAPAPALPAVSDSPAAAPSPAVATESKPAAPPPVIDPPPVVAAPARIATPRPAEDTAPVKKSSPNAADYRAAMMRTHLHNGLNALTQQKMYLLDGDGRYVSPDSVENQSRGTSWQPYNLHKEGGKFSTHHSEPVLEIPSHNVKDFILSLTADGRTFVSSYNHKTLALVDKARCSKPSQRGLGETFTLRSGLFGLGRTPLQHDFEAVNTLTTGKLILNYKDAVSGDQVEVPVKSQEELEQAIREMKDRVNIPA